MTKVMCFGTFDLLHLGHLDYFKQAKKHADNLIVVVARDKTKEKLKKEIVFDEKERLELVKSLKIVDEAVLGDVKDHLKVILNKKPNVICLGYDHPIKEKYLSEKLLPFHLYPKVVRAKAYQDHKHKSSLMKEKIFESK